MTSSGGRIDRWSYVRRARMRLSRFGLQDRASADPRRLDQSARNCGPKPLHARQRGERADAGLKNWKVLRKIRSRPNRADELIAAVQP
jgi:hypothetical protein